MSKHGWTAYTVGMDDSRDLSRRRADTDLLGTLNKSVVVLAMEPRSMALTVTSRKIYNVLIRLAQMATRDDEGAFHAPLSGVINMAGSSTKVADRIQGYIDQMVQTTVLLHLVSDTDARTLDLEGFEPAAQPTGGSLQEGDERRTFPLLAEVRWSFVGGRHWLRWWFPPSILEQLVSPDRWAQIEFNSVVALNTYTSVALYEILARFKDAPGGLTARHPPEWWTRMLREGGPGVKLREWRKFKSEMLLPAIAEVNGKTEIFAELVEHREHGVVKQVQFRVRRQQKPRLAQAAVEAIDVSLPLRAAGLGVRDDELEQLVDKYGAMKVAEGLDALEKAMAKPGAATIVRRGSYLRRMLSNRFPDGGAASAEPELAPAERAHGAATPAEREKLAQAWRAARFSELEHEFAQLPPLEQNQWIEDAGAKLPSTPGVRKRLQERDWRSPVIRTAILTAYAAERYGPGWSTPTAADLESFESGPRSRFSL